MDKAQLQHELTKLHITPPELHRAALYLHFLQHNQDFLQQMKASDNGFVSPALARPDLLNTQAQTFDKWVGAAISAELEREIHATPTQRDWTYEHYFAEKIFATDSQQFERNLRAFFARYPITQAALEASSRHFEQNLLLACQRITQDLAAITQLFADRHPGLQLHSLQEISSTGSDFHKGGQQVLLLRFQATSADNPQPFDFRLVYKPADLSADCLLVGDSAAVNRVWRERSSDTPANDAAFMSASLVEIFNVISNEEAQHSAKLPHLALPTYRILPMQVTQHPITCAQFQRCYGYLEYIASEAADNLITPEMDSAAIVQRFYRQMGQWLALCSSFCLSDLHLQNWRVHNFRPYPIDLEVAFIKPLQDFSNSELFGPFGGITGESEKLSEWKWHLNQRFALLSQQFHSTRYHNRLYQQTEQGSTTLVVVDQAALLDGFQAGMHALARGQQQNAFGNWLARLQGVLVRYLPYPTHALEMLRRRLYIESLFRAPPANGLAESLSAALQQSLLGRYQAEIGSTDLPHFVLLQEQYCGADYLQFDIPAFYHCVGTQDLLDARGTLVQIPEYLTLASGQQIALGIGRSSFFAAVPTAAHVSAPLASLHYELETRLQHLAKSIKASIQTMLAKPSKHW